MAIYTAPGSMPSNLSNQYSAEFDPYAGAAAFISGAATSAMIAPGLIDAALMTLRGGGKLAAALPFSFGNDIAKGVEATIPEPFATKAVENILLNQQREQIAQKTGEAPFIAGNLTGGIAGPVALASKFPVVGAGIDTLFDLASGTPGASQYLAGASNIGQSLARGAKVGLGASILPAVDVSYNAAQGTIDPMAGLATLGFGTALGTGVSALPSVLKSGKEVVDNISNAVKQRSAQSDTVATMRQMSQRRYAMQQQQNQIVQQQVERLPLEAPQILEPSSSVYSGAGVGEKTVAPRAIDNLPVQEGPVRQLQDEYTSIEIENKQKRQDLFSEFKTLVEKKKEIENALKSKSNIKYSDENIFAEADPIDNAIADFFGSSARGKVSKDSFIRLAKAADDKVLNSTYFKRKSNFNELKKSPDKINLYEGGNIEDEIPQQILEFLPEGLKNNPEVIAQLPDRIIAFMEKNPSGANAYRKQTKENILKQIKERDQFELEKIQNDKVQIEQRLKNITSENRNINDVFTFINEERSKRLPVIIPKATEVPALQEARFLSSEQGIKDLENPNPPMPVTKQEVPVIQKEPVVAPIKETIIAPEKLDPIDNIKRNVNSSDRFTPIVSKLSRLSPKLGAAIAKFGVAPQIIEQRIIEEIAPLLKVLKKYENDPAMRKVYGNISQLGYDAIPDPKYRKALEDFQVIANKYRTQLNEKGMEIGAPYEIYGPRGYDMARLEEKLGPILSAEYRKLEPRVQEKYLSRKLEKERTIPEITDEIVDAFSPLKGVENWVRSTSEKLAEAELFGNTTGDYGTNIMNLVSKYQKDFTPSKDNKNIQEAVSTLDEVFGNKDLARSKGYKMATSILSAINYTGKGTGLSQANDVITSFARNGVIETIEGAVDTIRTIVPNTSRQPILRETLKKVGALENAESFADTGQLDKFFDIFGLLKSKQFKEAGIKSLENAGIAASKANYLVLRMFDIAGKKLNVLGAHNKFKRNPELIQKDINMYEINPEAQKIILDYYKGFKTNKNQKYETVPLEVLSYLSNHALAYHVKSSFDRSLGAISRGDIERLAQFGFGFTTKYAITAQDRLRVDMENAFKSRSFIKPAQVIADKTLKIVAAVGGATVLGLMGQGYSIAGEEGLPVGWEDVVKIGFQTIVGLASPLGSRVLGIADTALRGNVGDSNTYVQLANQIFRGTGNVGKVISDALVLTAEGRPGDILDPNTNESFKLIPPRYITETIYDNSREGRNAKTKLEIYKATQEGAKQQELDNQYQRAAKALQKYQLLDPEDVKILTQGTRGTTEYAKALARSESALGNYKQYGTTDLEAASPAIIERNAMKQKVLQGLVETQQAFRAGEISPNEFSQRMAQYRILKKRYNIR